MARVKSQYRAREWVRGKPLPKCKPGCIHQRVWDANGTKWCAYILDVGHCRPCPGGPECTEYKRGKRRSRCEWEED